MASRTIICLCLLLVACYGSKLSVTTEDGPLDHLNVHVISHTHDDVGWLKTVDQYYYGANQSIQDAGVQYILDNVIIALQENPERKFIYVEIAFFERWWNEQTSYKQDIVRNLVKNGQLEFINGGWCMNDEANTEYEAIVDQMTQGHLWLFNQFGVKPRIGWHIDPFGHASTQASLFAQMGFDAFFFGRIDYQDHNIRNATQQLEFIWEPSSSLGSGVNIFTHVLWSDYCYPSGFGFEYGADPIQDDPRLFNLNVQERCDDFASQVRQRSLAFRTDNIMIPFGCDFQFENAIMEFKNMDKIIAYINAHKERYNLTLKYSTPSIYLDAVHASNIEWEPFSWDFFPYADYVHAYWSGYFTSRPALKGYVRTRGNLLHSTDKLFTMSTGLVTVDNNKLLNQIDVLSQAFSVAQHHDAVAGTEKQHVAYDYALRLSIGTDNANQVLNEVLGKLINFNSKSNAPQFQFCPYLNMSICPALDALKNGQIVPIVVYNPIAWKRSHFIRIPVPNKDIVVYDGSGVPVFTQTFENTDIDGIFTAVFQVNLPPLGYETYFVEPATDLSLSVQSQWKEAVEDFKLENEFLTVTFSSKTGSIASITNKANGQTLQINQEYLWYNGSAGNNNDTQASGAYIFRPNTSDPFAVSSLVPEITYTTGKLVSEARQTFNESWVTQIVRLYAGSPFLEFESTVGPIPIADGLGKEVITRFTTNLDTKNIIYTDSEGQEFLQRKLDARPYWDYNVTETVASNYYPMNTGAYIKDSSNQFTLVTDRSRGVASLKNGQIETMIHRRLLYDDARGVGEPLNETEAVRTTQIASYTPLNQAMSLERQAALLLNNQPILAFTTASNIKSWVSNYRTNFSAVSEALPTNVHLMTLKTLTDGRVLLRLNHIFAVNEDSTLSKPVTVNLSTLLTNFMVTDLTEMSLSANQPKSEVHRLKWKISGDNQQRNVNSKPVYQNSVGDYLVTLSPMEIRTFMVRLQPK